MVGKPKGDVRMTERVFMRLTAEDKALFMGAAENYTGGTVSDFWRTVIDTVSRNTLEYTGGAITYEELKANVGVPLANFIISSVEKTEDETEDEGEQHVD